MDAAHHPSDRMKLQLSLRQRGISDQAVLRALETVPRDAFVTSADRARAYRDIALPIACGQTISQPFVVAYMTEQLQVRPGHRVLEIGTGSGYQAAVLSQIVAEVVSLERFRTLAESAAERLSALGHDNVRVVVGDGLVADVVPGLFDRIIVTAAVQSIPEPLVLRLASDGILIAPVGPPHGVQKLQRVRLTGSDREIKNLCDVRFVPALPGLARET